jgi:endonuclease/exonuclease/phosphatase family metal-dependent hydrolase
MRIATWNVERVKPGARKAAAQTRRMADVDADIWVLTETHLNHRPSDDHAHAALSPPYPARRPPHERWAAIWSRWPLTALSEPVPHPRGTVAAMVYGPAGPFIVYATVIPWAHDPQHDDGRPARAWEAHLAAIERQGAEWALLRSAHPDVPLIVAGDFNQHRDGRGRYGTRATRSRLDAALGAAGLVCLTEFDAVASGKLKQQRLIDHICVAPPPAVTPRVSCWEHIDDSGQRLSDHPVVAVDLVDRPRSR